MNIKYHNHSITINQHFDPLNRTFYSTLIDGVRQDWRVYQTVRSAIKSAQRKIDGIPSKSNGLVSMSHAFDLTQG